MPLMIRRSLFIYLLPGYLVGWSGIQWVAELFCERYGAVVGEDFSYFCGCESRARICYLVGSLNGLFFVQIFKLLASYRVLCVDGIIKHLFNCGVICSYLNETIK